MIQNLEDYIKNLKIRIDLHREGLKEDEQLLTELQNAQQPTAKELYSGIENYIDVLQEHGDYKWQQGSQLGSNEHNISEGLIITTTIKPKIWLSAEQEKIVKDYVRYAYKGDKYNFKNFKSLNLF